MRDRDVREALRKKIFADHIRDPETLVMEELGVCHGEARVDVAVINGRLSGYEIKSDADTLDRLPQQIKTYGGVFDRLTLVVGNRHLSHAIALVPSWWGIKLATVGPRKAVHFADVRAPRANVEIVAVQLAKLLWREEALSLLQKRNIKGYKSKNRSDIYHALVEIIPLEDLKDEVRSCLKSRQRWRPGAAL